MLGGLYNLYPHHTKCGQLGTSNRTVLLAKPGSEISQDIINTCPVFKLVELYCEYDITQLGQNSPQFYKLEVSCYKADKAVCICVCVYVCDCSTAPCQNQDWSFLF